MKGGYIRTGAPVVRPAQHQMTDSARAPVVPLATTVAAGLWHRIPPEFRVRRYPGRCDCAQQHRAAPAVSTERTAR